MSDEYIKLIQDQLSMGPQPGERWIHYKGGSYIILCRSISETTLEPLVTYKSEEKGYVWTRTLKNFLGMVNDSPRFERVPNFE